MPRIQTFVSNQVREEIDAIITERRQEGATETDATVSSITSMLVELGLRVYRIQREMKEGGFNQMEYNKVMLESMVRVRAMCSEILKMNMLSEEPVASGKFDAKTIKLFIDKVAKESVGIFFPDA
ncbi:MULTISPECIES: conjugal transfer relaxosome DNA-binding protein TraM [Enterobacter]|uniref:conjugal transfer relaxosome DNA-binding protein TraM n=1 Tax=Enterobacter TaxID=547 RepID=UPI0010CA2D8C|nr:MULTISPECIES: conjugal transfer relaxosome DNA-binding protein TraM [Enterobacter]MCG7803943.1 relaxosome protein TraM [Enterobacter asburiae]UAN18842.1 relaxosome protein TraM [Enterobacter asburiae]UAN34129.1 relaxosome protein TraM [Enterobacter sp. JBIWA005]UKU10048.1 conjugal transfer protein TraM [Enterobacter asburiae]BBJ69832.1 conjugal transfer protein TraM [Enterobacter sp. 18A13]